MHLRSIGCCGRVFRSFKSYLSNRYIKVVTPFDSSDLHPVSAGVPQGAIWSPLLFNFYIRLLPSVPRHCLVVGYADDHTLFLIRTIVSLQLLNSMLIWQLCASMVINGTSNFPFKDFSLVASLKSDIPTVLLYF